MSTPRPSLARARRDRRPAHAMVVVLALLVALPEVGSAAPRLIGDRFYDDTDRPIIGSWAAGLQDPGQLDSYLETGFTLLYLRLPDSGNCKEMAREAARRGLGVILELNPIDALAGQGRLALDDPGAVRATAVWLADTVAEWQSTPGLVAWALQDQVEERVAWSPQGFAQYLAWKYENDPAELSAAWGAEVADFAAAGEIGAAVDEASPGKIGNPALDHAAWGRDGVQAVLRGWASAIAAVDPEHPVIGGRMDRFRTLLAAPEELAGLQPAMLPAGGWHDPVLHQAGAVQVASQTGRFAALPWLQAAADPISLWRWMRVMFGRGAAGVAFDRWDDLTAQPERRRAVALALAEAAESGVATFRPAASAAVVLSPLARGPRVGGRAVHGYGAFGDDEPAGLLALLRKGSRHGPLDVLGVRDLQRVELSRYGAIFVPAAFDLPASDCERLREYVRAGGILFSDLGAGAMQMGGDLTALPFPLVQACGLQLRDVRILEDVALNDRQRERLRHVPPGALAFPELTPTLSHPGSLVFLHRTALFPEIYPVISTPPAMAATLLRSPTAFFEPLGPEIRIIAEQTEIGGRAGTPPAYAGLALNPFGSGLAVYCGNFLWQAWGPDEPLFDAVHDGVMRQRPQISELGRLQLCDETLQLARGSDDRVRLHRVADTPTRLQLDLPTIDGRLYTPGFNFLRRPLAKDPASPVLIQTAPFINRRIVDLEGGELRMESPSPLVLWPQADGAAADVTEYSPEAIRMRIFGMGEQASQDVNGRWVVVEPRPAEATLVIADGLYRVLPGSLHRAEWWLAPQPSVAGDLRVGRGKRYQTLTAGSDGRLTMRERFTDELLRLTPVAGSGAAAEAE